MIVCVRLEVTDEQRRAWRRACGRTGLATRAEIASLVEGMLANELDEAMATWPAKSKVHK